MKNLILCLCLLTGAKTFAFPGKIVKGNGAIKSETREVTGYTGIASHGMMKVIVSYGSSNSITVETDENILPYLKTKVDDNVLIIKVKDLAILKPANGIRIHVTMTKIKSIKQSGSGNITGEGDFSNEGATTFAVSGSGGINMAFASINGATVKTSGSGGITLTGNVPGALNVLQHGSGHVDCKAAPCENAKVHISGTGNTTVNFSKAMTVRISGCGHVSYKGSSSQINKKISGSGSISSI